MHHILSYAFEQRSLKKCRGRLTAAKPAIVDRDGTFEILPVTLREAAVGKVLNGTTTVSEMFRVTGK